MMMKFVVIWVALILALFSFNATAADGAQRLTMMQWVEDNAVKPMAAAQAKKVVEATVALANAKNIDPTLVLAMMRNESGFNPNAKGGASVGLMQVIPRWHRDKIKGRNVLDPVVNAEVGIQVLGDCLDKFKGHTFRALNCYSGGGGQVYMKKVVTFQKDLKRTLALTAFKNNRLEETTEAKLVAYKPTAPPVAMLSDSDESDLLTRWINTPELHLH